MLNTGEILEKYLRGRMSMTDLANILGISPQYISSVVKNVKRPSKNVPIIDMLLSFNCL